MQKISSVEIDLIITKVVSNKDKIMLVSKDILSDVSLNTST